MASLSLTLGECVILSSCSGDSGAGEGCCNKCYGENPSTMRKVDSDGADVHTSVCSFRWAVKGLGKLTILKGYG